MKLAKFETGHGSIHYFPEETGKLMEDVWIRLTEYAEVEFVPLSTDEVVGKQLKAIDTAEQLLREKFQEKLNELTEQRSKLLALTHQTESA